MSDRSPTDSAEPAAAGSTDPQLLSTIVVTTEDVVTAIESTRGTGRETVLRITPPFSGRMRARLHVAGHEGTYDGPEPIHVDPETLIESVPAYPTAAETARELDSTAAINTDRHETTHTERLEAWRATVRDNTVAEADIETPAGPVAVEVRWLDNE